MKTTDITLKEFSKEELNNILGGSVRLVSIYRDGKPVVIISYS